MFNKKLSESEIDRFLDQYTPKANHVIFRGIIARLNSAGHLHGRSMRRFTRDQEKKSKANGGNKE